MVIWILSAGQNTAVAVVPDFSIEWDAVRGHLVLQLTKKTIAALKADAHEVPRVHFIQEGGNLRGLRPFRPQEAASGSYRVAGKDVNRLDVKVQVVLWRSGRIKQSPAKDIPQAAINYAQKFWL
eukprot:140615_1